LQKCFTR